jgi:hypothetical protein
MAKEKVLTPEEQKFADESQARADAIAARIGRKVYPLAFIINERRAAAYIQEPSLQAKLSALDELGTSMTKAGQTILDSSIIKEDSDAAFTSLKSEDDAFRASAIMECISILEVGNNLIKKK